MVLFWVSLGLVPFLIGLVIGRRWALAIGAGVAGTIIVAHGLLFGEPDPHGEGEWPLWFLVLVLFPVFVGFPAVLSAATGMAARIVALRVWAKWHPGGRTSR